MIIARFGAVYATAYQFPQFGMVDDWSLSRPPVYAKASGKSGVFDFYGDGPFPRDGVTLRKSMIITGSGSTLGFIGIQTELDALIAATMDVGESFLWGLRRDGGTRFMRAKCVRLNISDMSKTHDSLPVTIEFYSRQGSWILPLT